MSWCSHANFSKFCKAAAVRVDIKHSDIIMFIKLNESMYDIHIQYYLVGASRQ